jgi:hypothetical protein|tara:strand:- start:5369 stop:5614 length:246 start_codon:yes stop_codon:yes gene_type:complete
MKIRYYRQIDGPRWIGFALAIVAAFILSEANPETQWIGWALASCSCVMWVYFGIKDKDTPRALMEGMYLLLSLRAIWNWVV